MSLHLHVNRPTWVAVAATLGLFAAWWLDQWRLGGPNPPVVAAMLTVATLGINIVFGAFLTGGAIRRAGDVPPAEVTRVAYAVTTAFVSRLAVMFMIPSLVIINLFDLRVHAHVTLSRLILFAPFMMIVVRSAWSVLQTPSR